MNKKSNKKGCVIFIVIAVLGVAGICTLIHFLKKEEEHEKQVTAALPQIVSDLITTDSIVKVLPIDSMGKPEFQKYLFLKQCNWDINGKVFYYYYSISENELLATETYATANDLDGVILGEKYSKIIGYYGEEKPENKAVKPAYVLHYVRLPEKSVVLRDTIWGTNPPPVAYRHRTSGSGEYPKLLEVVDKVKKIIRNN